MKTKVQWVLSITAIVLGITLALLSPAHGQIMGPGGGGALVGAGGFSGGSVSTPILAPVSATSTSAPGYAFASKPTTGWGFAADNTLYAINQGQRVFYASTTGAAWDVPLLQLDGSQSAPTYAFIGAPNTGMWRSAGGNLILGVNGSIALTVAPTFIAIGNTASIQVANTTGLDTAGAPFTYQVLNVPATTSTTATATQSGAHFTNTGAAGHVDITTPVGATVGYCLTISDTTGVGGVGFIAQTGETIRLGVAIVSSTNRKVSTASAAPGAEATICKETSTLWIGHGTAQGTWTGS